MVPGPKGPGAVMNRREIYKAYMTSAQWRKKREQAFAYWGRRCFVCGKRGSLQVHHLSYAMFMNERMQDLRPLCALHHREVERYHWSIGKQKYSGLQAMNMFILAYRRNRGRKAPQKPPAPRRAPNRPKRGNGAGSNTKARRTPPRGS